MIWPHEKKSKSICPNIQRLGQTNKFMTILAPFDRINFTVHNRLDYQIWTNYLYEV